jgi:hypothetical protein
MEKSCNIIVSSGTSMGGGEVAIHGGSVDRLDGGDTTAGKGASARRTCRQARWRWHDGGKGSVGKVGTDSSLKKKEGWGERRGTKIYFSI